MPLTKEQLQERAQLVRIHEANCQIDHPNELELAFRLATMIKIGREFNLKEHRSGTTSPPVHRTD
jgi:hypothetical protein